MRLIDADALIEPMKLLEESYRRCGAIERAEAYANCLWEIKQAPTVGGWVSVNDRLPDSGKHVLVCCEVRPSKKRYVCDGYYASKHSIATHDVDDDIAYEYDEEEDEYFLLEGWYEVIKNWDDYDSVVIDDFVTHWMPLPEPPEEGEVG